jgi:hypothetical protein
MAGEAKTCPRDPEVTAMEARFVDDCISAFILGVPSVSVVKIHAKQSQFQGGRINAKHRSGRELGGNHADHACGKTKPIALARL